MPKMNMQNFFIKKLDLGKTFRRNRKKYDELLSC